MSDTRLYDMDELARIFRTSRAEALSYLHFNAIPTVRYRGNSYVYENEIVRHLMAKHKKEEINGGKHEVL